MLDAVYIDAKKYKTIVAIKPKPPFIPIFQVAVSKKESDIRIINEPLNSLSKVPSVFLVETGEALPPRQTRDIIKQLNSYKSRAASLLKAALV